MLARRRPSNQAPSATSASRHSREPFPPSQTVSVGIDLTSPNQAAEDAYVKQLYNPSSANYENFLDPETFNSQFGVPAAKFQAAESWATSQGLTVSEDRDGDELLHGERNRRAGRVGLRDAAQDVHVRRPRVLREHGRAVGAGFFGVGDVVGLDNYNRFFTPRVNGQIRPEATASNVAGLPATPNTGLLSPKDVASAYDVPATNHGNGQSMAILGWGVTTPVLADLRSFEAEWGLPAVQLSTKYYGDASTPDTNDGGTVEWEMDTQASTGMASNAASEKLDFAHHNTDADILAAIAGWVSDRFGPAQASASSVSARTSATRTPCSPTASRFPAIRFSSRPSSRGARSSLLRVTPARLPGRSGEHERPRDAGLPGLEWPSVSPWAVAVGGTDLTSDGNNPAKRFAETAWEFTGGGNSTGEPAGSYQAGVASTNCTFDQNGNPYVPVIGAAGPVCRSTPDVAAISATSRPATGC